MHMCVPQPLEVLAKMLRRVVIALVHMHLDILSVLAEIHGHTFWVSTGWGEERGLRVRYSCQ